MEGGLLVFHFILLLVGCFPEVEDCEEKVVKSMDY